MILMEHNNTPNRSNVVGILFPQMFPHFINSVIKKLCRKSFIFRRTPILCCDPNGIRTKKGIHKFS